MSTISQRIEMSEDRGIEKRAESYLSLQEAARLVEKCSQKRTAVIGIDFVYLREGKVQPHVPINSADWSPFLQAAHWQDVVARCNAASLQVLAREEKEDSEQFCSLVFFSEEEWTADDQPQSDQS